MAFPDAWEEVALVSVTRFSTTDAATRAAVQCNAMTETIDISEPDYPGEGIPNIAGGRIWKQSPQEDGEITLELYPIQASAGDGENNLGLFQQFVGVPADAAYDTGEPIITTLAWAAGIQRTRSRFRVTILWTNDTAPPATAETAIASGKEALRFSAMGCRMTSHKTSYTDGIVKTTVTFKFPAMNTAGTVQMFRWDSCDSSAAMAALSAYDDEDAWA